MKTEPDRFVALLRGINVGGNNIIAKDDLRECFEDIGMTNVRTYIQSGNILFRAAKSKTKNLTDKVEKALSKRFTYKAQAVVLSFDDYKKALNGAPADWGQDNDYKHNAIFMIGETKPKDLLAILPPPKPDIENYATGPGVLFWSGSKEYQSRTTLIHLAKSPIYKQVTVRNHNTTFKLMKLFEEI